jgi:hypothetical protein
MKAMKVILLIMFYVLLCSGFIYAAASDEAVVTKVQVKTFDEAKSKAVKSVNDGDPVWLWIRFQNPVETYLAKWEFGGKELDVLYFEIGPEGSPKTTFNDGFIIPKQSELKGHAISVNLAPGELAEMNLGAWMKTVGNGSSGKWNNEIRVYKLDDPRTKGTAGKTLVVTAPLTADVNSGASKYKAMYRDYEKRWDAGDPSFNKAPERGGLVERALTPVILKQTSDTFGVKSEAFYFIAPGWYDEKDALGRLVEQHAFGVVYYQKNGKKYLKYVNIFRKANGQIEVRQRDNDRELTAENYNTGLSYSK